MKATIDIDISHPLVEAVEYALADYCEYDQGGGDHNCVMRTESEQRQHDALADLLDVLATAMESAGSGTERQEEPA